MTRNLDEIYTRQWYEKDFAELGPEFELVAKGIDCWASSAKGLTWSPAFDALDALDVGCGPGLLVAALKELGWRARGFDGSRHAIEYAKAHVKHAVEWITVADVLDENEHPTYDLVICTEVAEHIPGEHAPTLVRYLCEHADGAIVFTAAPPGQGGHDHVNEQPMGYWVELFADHGWIWDREATRELQERWQKLRRLSHMIRNLAVFR